MAGCREHPPTLRDDTLFKIAKVNGADYCAAESVQSSDCTGWLYLKKNGKALYFMNCGDDSTLYYRGTYYTTDTGLRCTFNSVYTNIPPCTNCPHESRPSRKVNQFNDDTTWYFSLLKSVCAPVIYTSEQSKQSPLYVVRKATLDDITGFCSFISGADAFIDFHCRKEPVSYERVANHEVSFYEEAEQYYRRRFEGREFTRNSDDSVTYLTIHKKNGDEAESDLYIEINRTPRKTLEGDLDKDGLNDLLMNVQLSEGASTWHDLFVFLQKDEYRSLAAVASDADLAICTGDSYGGYFLPVKIVNGSITGESKCYTEEDAECCPSIKVNTVVKLENNSLKPYKK
jgi:hypothetical protein